MTETHTQQEYVRTRLEEEGKVELQLPKDVYHNLGDLGDTPSTTAAGNFT